MANATFTGLCGIATAEVDGLLAGIRGVPGKLWTANMRAVIRKDDPPEEDDAE